MRENNDDDTFGLSHPITPVEPPTCRACDAELREKNPTWVYCPYCGTKLYDDGQDFLSGA